MSLFEDEVFEVAPEKSKNGKRFEDNLYKDLRTRYPNAIILEQKTVGNKIGSSKKYVADILFNQNTLISAKYQEVGGTAEQKIPHEIVNLQYLCDKYGYRKAYLVYDGPGFTLTESYSSEEMSKYVNAPNVTVLSFDDFKEIDIGS